MKKIVLLILFVSSFGFSQNLDNYKYALVPAQFTFLKEVNQYNLNVMTKLFMEKYGFVTFMDNETYSEEFALNNFNKVFVEIQVDNTMFRTKLKVVLKDLTNKVVFVSAEGLSRNKEYKIAYKEALRSAFNSFDALNHNYKEQKNTKVADNLVKQISTTDQLPITSSATDNLYYAQPTTYGYQLINSEPKVIYKLTNTSSKDYFIASKGAVQGVFFLKNSEWFFEYNENDKLISEKVAVKF